MVFIIALYWRNNSTSSALMNIASSKTALWVQASLRCMIVYANVDILMQVIATVCSCSAKDQQIESLVSSITAAPLCTQRPSATHTALKQKRGGLVFIAVTHL